MESVLRKKELTVCETKKAKTRGTRLVKNIKKYYGYYILLILPITYFIIFKYVPMIGNILAFRRYSAASPLLGSKWVGLLYFNQFLTNPEFWKKFTNTLFISIGTLLFQFPLPIIFALLLNEIKNVKFKKVVQTASYLPHFISVVVVAGIVMQVLSPSSGIINDIIEPGWFRTIYISSAIWQQLGWNAIIYIAALAGVDPELYEAALIDGANRFKQTIHITIPSISTTIIISLILAIGRIMTVGYEKILLLMNDLNRDTADVISTYVYKIGLIDNNFSFSTAVGLFEAIIGLILVCSANYVSKKITDSSLW